jgi:hypothetical protein
VGRRDWKLYAPQPEWNEDNATRRIFITVKLTEQIQFVKKRD